MEPDESTEVYAHPRLSVREDAVHRPDGTTGTYVVVDAADIVLVVPLDGDRLRLVEQYRHPVRGRRWEFPSGGTEHHDADAAAAAARELREETGLVADSLEPLGALEITPSTMTQRCRVFLATGLAEHAVDLEPEEQDLRSAWFTRGEVERLLLDGTLSDAKTAAAYALLLLHEGAGRAGSLLGGTR